MTMTCSSPLKRRKSMSRLIEEVLEEEMFIEQVGFGADGMMVTFSNKSDQRNDCFAIVSLTAFIPFTGENANFRELAFAEQQQKLRWLIQDGYEELAASALAGGTDTPAEEEESPTPW